MIDTPLISILMPCYNGLPYIKASILSLMRQTYTRWECIIVDDGSKDNTYAYLQTIKDPRFRVFRFEKNQGRPTARQKTLDEAQGDYIAMLDAGDVYHPQKLEKQVNVFKKYKDVVLVSGNMCSYGTKTDILRKRGASAEHLLFFNGTVPNHACSMILASEAKLHRYNPMLKMGQDKDFLEHVLKRNNYVELPDILYYYSEFDSVTKNKIIKTHKLNIKKLFFQKRFKDFFITVLKYFYCLITYPFQDINSILERRGIELTPMETEDYYRYCFTLLRDTEEN